MRFLLFSEFKKSLGIDLILIDALLILWNMLIIGLTASHFLMKSVYSQISMILAFLVKINTFSIVIFVDYATSCYLRF